MAGGTLEHLHAHARVRATVADGAHLDGGEVTVGVATRPVLEADGVALRVHTEALFARQRALHRSVEQPGGERGVGLVAHVLLATKRTTVRHQGDGDGVVAHTEHAGDVVAVVPHALAARVHLEMAGAIDVRRDGQRGLGLEERVLDALGLEGLVHRVRAVRQCSVDVATPVLADAQHVRLGLPHGEGRVRLERGDGVGDRGVHLVGHTHRIDRGARLFTRVGDHDGKDVTGVAGAPAHRDHHRPVLVDDADQQFARHVGRGEHGVHPGSCQRLGGVDRQHVGAGVRGEMERGMECAGHPQVVDVPAIAEREGRGLVLRTGCADRGGQLGRAHGAAGDGLDRVEHLHVAGASAQVGAEVAAHLVAPQIGPLLVDLGLGAHDDAGNAEAALQATAGRERVGEAPAFGLGDALEGDDRLARHLGDGLLAADDGLAVDVHGAAPALPTRRTPVLGRGEVEFVAQRRQQVGVV